MERTRQEIIQDIFTTLELTKRAMRAQFFQFADIAKLNISAIYLLFIIEREQPIHLKELACRMQITPGAITQTIETLVREEYITRTQDERDRRIVYVSLTKKGAHKVAALQKAQQAYLTRAVSGVEDSDLATYLRVQRLMLDQMEKETKKEEKGETK